MNKKRKVTKRIAAWLLSFAMVLTTINLPAFTTEVKAAETVQSSITIDGKEYNLYTGFTATDGTKYADSVDYSYAVDGNLSTMWRDIDTASDYSYIEFSSDVPIILKGYILNSYNEKHFHPTDRRLYAKANENDEYVLVSSYTNEDYSTAESYFPVVNEDNNQYRYFRFEGTNKTKNIFLYEIRLYGGKEMAYAFLPQKNATCTKTGIKQDCYVRSDGKYFTDQTGTTELSEEDVIAPIVPHTLEDETAHVSTCSGCRQTIVTGPHIFLDENGETLDCICGEINPDHNHGYCGDSEVNDGKDVTWRVTQEEDGNYTLTISGTGRMADFHSNTSIPWNKAGQRNYWDKITKAVVSDGVTYVGIWAFVGLSGLKEATIPSSVTTFGYDLFWRCTALDKVEIPCSLEYASNWNVDESAVVKYHVFEKQPFIDEGDGTHYQNCKCGNESTIPENHNFSEETHLCVCGVEEPFTNGSCGDAASYKFYECGTLVISGTGAIMDFAFLGSGPKAEGFTDTSKIQNVVIENGITDIGRTSFAQCSALKTVKMADSVINMASYPFDTCPALISVDLSKNLKTIGQYAFQQCTSLEKIVLPDSIESIEQMAFYKCTSLSDITIPASLSITDIPRSVFRETPWLEMMRDDKSLVVINNVLYDGTKCSGDCIIPNGVVRVGDTAFVHNADVVSITIPSSVISIGRGVWAYCHNLSRIVFEGKVESFNDATFLEYYKNPTIVVPDEFLNYYKQVSVLSSYTIIPASCDAGEHHYEADEEGHTCSFCGATGNHDFIEEDTLERCRVCGLYNIRFLSQPEDTTANSDIVIFRVECKGADLAYQWQWRRDDSYEWSAIGFTGNKTPSLLVEAISARNGFRYRCKVTDKFGTVAYSEPATLYVSTGVRIYKNPEDVIAKDKVVNFKVSAFGDGNKYQWEWRRNSSYEWADNGFTGCRTNCLNVEAISARNGFQYRCKVTDKYGVVAYSEPATLYYGDVVKIINNPENQGLASGTVKFTVGATGENLTYLWQWRRNASYEWATVGFTGYRTNTLSVDAIPARNGFQYRCQITDKFGNIVYSEPATLYVTEKTMILKNPEDVIAKGTVVSFNVTAIGDGLTYQWEWRRNESYAWANNGFVGCKTNSLNVEAISARNGFQYRCKITDKAGFVIYSEPATLYYGTTVSITKQPVNITAEAGSQTKFNVEATGDGLIYQWYWRKNSSYEWGVCGFAGARTASMNVEAIAARNGYQYRCVVKDKFGNVVESKVVTLTVK